MRFWKPYSLAAQHDVHLEFQWQPRMSFFNFPNCMHCSSLSFLPDSLLVFNGDSHASIHCLNSNYGAGGIVHAVRKIYSQGNAWMLDCHH